MDNYRKENIKKLNIARKISALNSYVSSTGKMCTISKTPTVTVIDYFNDIHLEKIGTKTVKNIVLEQTDSFTYVSSHFSEFTSKPLVLDFANPCVPGGGVRKGCRAQEEDLCRRSNLLMALESEEADPYYSENKYTVRLCETSLKCILVKDVTIFADSDGNLIDPIVVDVLVAAAPYKLSETEIEDFELGLDFIDDMEFVVDMILDVAESYCYKDIILGAFGCGAFHNKPSNVARIFRDHLNSGRYSFTNVAFPILVKLQNRDQKNWDHFSEVLS